ncbi:hypothetical protein QVD17_16200 [Tagetes erecta]|uniref:Uncharacterized protein n=1 Tax=Tagetes erecta TaxID=13708 RepID=A0AAD8KQH7_TARER|nr:hypothetical protein QVD17_16200 [Tagetes erecta]
MRKKIYYVAKAWSAVKTLELLKACNEFLFNAKPLEVCNVVDKIKFYTFVWMKKRAKLGDLAWQSWCSFSFRMFPL